MSSRLSLKEIKEVLEQSSIDEVEILLNSLESDDRTSVKKLVISTRKNLERRKAEIARVRGMYDFDLSQLTNPSKVVLGLDEVGRGPIAGPLAVGGVVLDLAGFIEGLNDSKLVSVRMRESIADEVKSSCIAYTVQYIEPSFIDEYGISAALSKAFRIAIDDIEAQGCSVDVILLDGNPMHLDTREVNVIKGDRKSASIAAASIVAKVSRDGLMDEYDKLYPGYDFSSNKGYGTKRHIEAIESLGLSTIHRNSFCTGFVQDRLF